MELTTLWEITLKAFSDLISRYAPLAETDAIASWDVPYRDASLWVSQGKLPAATVLLGDDQAIQLDFLQSFHLLTFKYQGHCEILVRHHHDRACLQVILLRKD